MVLTVFVASFEGIYAAEFLGVVIGVLLSVRVLSAGQQAGGTGVSKSGWL